MKRITCLSDLYYIIGYWFTAIMLIGAIITLPFALNKVDSIISFLMCIGIAFVGCAANFKDKTEYPIHYISACVSGISSILFTIIINPWLLFIGLISLIGIIDKKRWLLWCEIPCFLMVYTALFI